MVNIVRSNTIPSSAQVFGNTMYLQKLGPLSWELSKNGIYEKDETEFVMHEIKKDSIVLDVGANIGYYTLIFAKLVGKNGKVFSFEPEPENFKLLKKNVETNSYPNVQLENAAVSNQEGKIKLYLSNMGAGQHKIYESKTVTNDFVLVNVLKLDDYFKTNPLIEKISFIKIDTEGSELGVLKGMELIIEKNKELKILLEFDPKMIKEYGTVPDEIINFLKLKGFKLSFFDKNGKIEEVKDITQLLKIYEDNLKSINLLCTKK